MKTYHDIFLVWGKRILFALLFTLLAAFVLLTLSPWDSSAAFEKMDDYLARIGTGVLLLILALLMRRSQRFEKYWLLLYALFILTVALSLSLVFGYYFIIQLGVTDVTPAGWALQKLNECFVVVSAIILFTLLSGESLSSIYLQKGNLKLGLGIGIGAFILFAAGAAPMASLFNAKDLSISRAIPWIPWILIYTLANGTMEEMLFRGLFLRKLEPFIGKYLSIFLLAFIFTGMHSWVSYTADNRLFLAVTFPLALILGYIMTKTDSAYGSILFHAGMDIPIMVGIFSNL